MHSISNKKMNQVTDQTLVVGMDIAKKKHYACFVDERGRVLKKPFPVPQLKEGLEWLYQCVVEVMKEFGKTGVIVGIEPTGHYWLNLAYFLDEKGIPLVMTNPMHVKQSKELDDNLPTKHDTKDALVIARLVKDGRFSYPRILKGMEAELRRGDVSLQIGGRTGGGSKSDDSLARSVFSRIYTSLSVFRKNSARCAGTDAVSVGFSRERDRRGSHPLPAKAGAYNRHKSRKRRS